MYLTKMEFVLQCIYIKFGEVLDILIKKKKNV